MPDEDLASRSDVISAGCIVDGPMHGWRCVECRHGFDLPTVSGLPVIGPDDVIPEVYQAAAALLRERTARFEGVAEGIRAGLDADPRRSALRAWLQEHYPAAVPLFGLRAGRDRIAVPRDDTDLAERLDAAAAVCDEWDAGAAPHETPGDVHVLGHRDHYSRRDDHVFQLFRDDYEF